MQAKRKIAGIVYCQRNGAPNVYAQLKTLEVSVLHIIKDLLSHKKQKNPKLLAKYRLLHQRPRTRNQNPGNCSTERKQASEDYTEEKAIVKEEARQTQKEVSKEISQ